MSLEEERVHREEEEERLRIERQRIAREEAETRTRQAEERARAEEELRRREDAERVRVASAREIEERERQTKLAEQRVADEQRSRAEGNARLGKWKRWIALSAGAHGFIIAGCLALYMVKLEPAQQAVRASLERSALEAGEREITALRRVRELSSQLEAAESRYRGATAEADDLRRQLAAARQAPPRAPAPPRKNGTVPGAPPPCTCDPHDPLCGCFR